MQGVESRVLVLFFCVVFRFVGVFKARRFGSIFGGDGPDECRDPAV